MATRRVRSDSRKKDGGSNSSIKAVRGGGGPSSGGKSEHDGARGGISNASIRKARKISLMDDGKTAPEVGSPGKQKKKLVEDGAARRSRSHGTSARNRGRSITARVHGLSRAAKGRAAKGKAGSFWEDAGRSSRPRKLLLKDGDLVPEEAFDSRPAARSIKNMSRTHSLIQKRKRSLEKKLAEKRSVKEKIVLARKLASRGRSISARNRGRSVTARMRSKSVAPRGKAAEDEENEAGSLWDDASRPSKSVKLLLEDGALVPEEAFESKSVAKSIKNTSRSRSLAWKNERSAGEEDGPAIGPDGGKRAFAKIAKEELRERNQQQRHHVAEGQKAKGWLGVLRWLARKVFAVQSTHYNSVEHNKLYP